MSVFPSSMPRRRASGLSVLAVLVLASTVLSGCGSGAFVDRRRDASLEELAYTGQSTPDAPSICYNSRRATPAQVLALANGVCAQSGRVAVLRRQTDLDCRLFYPSRADFVCVEPGSTAAQYGIQP